MLNPKITILFLVLLSANSLKFGNADVLLEKVERWIRYSIHEEEDRGAYRNSDVTAVDDYLPPKVKLRNLTRDKNSALGKFSEKANLDVTDSSFWCGGQTLCSKSLKAIEMCQWLIKEDLERWGKTDSAPSDIAHTNENRLPKWLRTVLKISDAIGWEHFDDFIFIINEHTKTRVLRRSRQQELQQQTQQNANISLVLHRMRPFCNKAGVDLSLLQSSLKSLTDEGLDGHLKPAIAAGAKASTVLFHLVLYQALFKALVDEDKQTGRQTSSPFPGILRFLSGPHTWHAGMSRRDYVTYWLHRIIRQLEEKYDKLRDEFVEIAIKPEPQQGIVQRQRGGSEHHGGIEQRQSGSEGRRASEREERGETEGPTLNEDWRVRLALPELAKYALRWDAILELVKRLGIQALDFTIDLFGDGQSEAGPSSFGGGRG